MADDANTPAAPTPTAASLYPDGGAAPEAPAATPAASGEQGPSSPGATPEAAPSPASLAGADGGTDTTPGAESPPTSEGAAPPSLTAESYTLTLPEGLTQDSNLLTSAATMFAEIGVAPDKAQQLVDFYASAVNAAQESALTAFNAQQTAWAEEINTIPEFQGEARATSLQAIGKVFDEFGTPEAREALNIMGVGNNPALVRMFLKLSQAFNEGAPVPAGNPPPNGRDGRPVNGRTVGQRLYPDLQTQ